MHNICDIALNSAQEYCSNQYASWKKEEKKWAREKKTVSRNCTEKCEITVERQLFIIQDLWFIYARKHKIALINNNEWPFPE